MDEMDAKLPGGKIKAYQDTTIKRLCIFGRIMKLLESECERERERESVSIFPVDQGFKISMSKHSRTICIVQMPKTGLNCER